VSEKLYLRPRLRIRDADAGTDATVRSSETCMCNDYRLEVETAAIFEDFADLKIKIRFSDSMGSPCLSSRSTS
jgi:hypothetical protein